MDNLSIPLISRQILLFLALEPWLDHQRGVICGGDCTPVAARLSTVFSFSAASRTLPCLSAKRRSTALANNAIAFTCCCDLMGRHTLPTGSWSMILPAEGRTGKGPPWAGDP